MSKSIEETVHIDAAPGVLFESLTIPDLLQKWLCHQAEVDPRVGGKYEMTWNAIDAGTQVRYHGAAEIVALEPDRKLAFRLEPDDGPSDDSVVEFILKPVDGGTDLTLTQTGFSSDDRTVDSRPTYQRGWLACMTVLRSLLEDEPAQRLTPALMHRDIPVPGKDPCGLAWDGKDLWIADGGRGRIYQVDARSGRSKRHLEFDGEASGLTFDGEKLWQADREDCVLVRVDPATGRTLKRMQLEHIEGELTGLTWDGSMLWVADHGESRGRVLRINPSSGMVVQKLEVTPTVSGLAWDGSHLWVADYERRVANRVSPRTGEVLRRVCLKGHPTDLTWDGDRLWYNDAEWNLASRILDGDLTAE